MGRSAERGLSVTGSPEYANHTINLLRRLLRKPVVALILVFILAAMMLTVFSIKRQEVPLTDDTGAVVVHIQGADRERLATYADDIAQRLRSMPDWREARHSLQASHEELSLRMNEDRARELGIEITDAGRALAIALTGIPAGDFRDAEHRYEIRLPPATEESSNAVALDRILLLGELEDRPAVHLGDVASVEHVHAPTQIRRRHGIPDVEIVASPAKGVSPEQAGERIHAMLEKYKLPAGYRSPSQTPEIWWKQAEARSPPYSDWHCFFCSSYRRCCTHHGVPRR